MITSPENAQRFALLECPCLGRGVSVSSAVIPTAGARTGREREGLPAAAMGWRTNVKARCVKWEPAETNLGPVKTAGSPYRYL